MKSRHLALLILGAAMLAGAALSPGCSSKSSTPTGPGGGGGLELNSGNVSPGATYTHRFFTAGVYNYHCSIHAAMTGNSVTVADAGTDTTAAVSIVSASAPGFSPSALTIKTGGKVVWTNNHSTTHTVTSN